ncbi:MAG: hypothetical protein ABI885_15570, partial [Gammaproteobacteria bacterium]
FVSGGKKRGFCHLLLRVATPAPPPPQTQLVALERLTFGDLPLRLALNSQSHLPATPPNC